jgi:hypothetical protein
MNHAPKVGAFVLETLTTGMYTNPLDSIREYIQNAADSIFSAERFKFLNKNRGRIEISIDPKTRTLSIRDNGAGVSSSEVILKLLNIGMSTKLFGQEAGFRGIGRLAGIAYCKRLQFITSYMYEDETSEINFNCEGIRRSISPSLKEVEELAEVVQKYTTQDLYEGRKDEHFFEVRLETLDENVEQFLDIRQLEEYLSQVAPVEYDAQRFVFATKIEKWAKDHGFDIPYIKLVIKGPEIERQVFKPYKTHYRTRKNDYDFDIKDIHFFPEDAVGSSSFWVWYSDTDLLGMFDDAKVAGLRFRRNNIAIGGPERVDELFPGNESRLNYWTMGEIQVLSNDIIPNARRDGFEFTPAWVKLKSDLLPFIKRHCKACHDASSVASRPTAKVIASAKSTIESTKKAIKLGLSSHEERQEILEKVSKEVGRVSAALNNRQLAEDRKKVRGVLASLEALKKTVEEERNFTIDKIKSNLDRKQRKILVDVLSLMNSALSGVECSKKRSCLETMKKAILAKYQATEN